MYVSPWFFIQSSPQGMFISILEREKRPSVPPILTPTEGSACNLGVCPDRDPTPQPQVSGTALPPTEPPAGPTLRCCCLPTGSPSAVGLGGLCLAGAGKLSHPNSGLADSLLASTCEAQVPRQAFCLPLRAPGSPFQFHGPQLRGTKGICFSLEWWSGRSEHRF